VSDGRVRARGRLLGRGIVLVLLGAGIVYAWRHHAAFDPLAISSAVATHPAAPLVFLALHLAASLFFIPRTILAMAAGLVFGVGWGLVWATAGSVLGAVAGFLIARYVNGGLIDPETMPRIGPVLQRAEAGGWRAVTALRLIPVLPHSLANYALGLTRLPLGAYALGSLLGQLPMTIAYVDLGAAGGRLWAGNAGWLAPTLIGGAALLLSLLLPRFVRSRG
jgi:uncharacterized membrane protein YdjX (TVP38/TMEM64 family)